MGKFWYLRHGQTYYNVESSKWHEEGDPEEGNSFQYTLDFADSALTETGINQALKAKDAILKLPIDVVYVSPMLRALQTCAHIFENCETRPKIIVNPLITEWIHVNHDAPMHPNNYKEQFSWFDWSLMPDTYFIGEILKNQYTETLMKQISENPQANCTKILIDLIHNIYPACVESNAELYARTQRFKDILREELKNKNILVVGHSAFVRHFTSVMVGENEFRGQVLLGNGQFIQYVP